MRNVLHLVWAALQLAGRDAPLYHATTAEKACSILSDNFLKGRENSNQHEESFFKTNGVSLTRDHDFAESWGDVIFVLDQTRLTQRSRIRPRDYFGPEEYRKLWTAPPPHRKEREEFIPGNIKPLSQFLMKVYFSPQLMARLDYFYTVGNGKYDIKMYVEAIMRSPFFDPKQKETVQNLKDSFCKRSP